MKKIPDNMSKEQYERFEKQCTCGNYRPYNPRGTVYATMQIGECVNCKNDHEQSEYHCAFKGFTFKK